MFILAIYPYDFIILFRAAFSAISYPVLTHASTNLIKIIIVLAGWQVAASVLRNLSWHADPAGKQALRAAGAVTALTRAALAGAPWPRKESALKAVLSALWNFTSHCASNKAEVRNPTVAVGF